MKLPESNSRKFARTEERTYSLVKYKIRDQNGSGLNKNKMEARREQSKTYKILRKNYFQSKNLNLANCQLNLRVKIFSVMQGLKKFTLRTFYQEATGGFTPLNWRIKQEG